AGKFYVFGSHFTLPRILFWPRLSGDDAHDVGLLHDQELLAVELDLGARPLAEQHAVACLKVRLDQVTSLVAAARADGDDLALLGLLLGGIGDDDATLGLLVGIDTPHDDAVVQGTELGFGHGFLVGAYARLFKWIRVVSRSC